MTNPARKYHNKPKVVEALQWTGKNERAIQNWMLPHKFHEIDPEDRGDNPEHTAELFVQANKVWVGVETGSWIAMDSRGFYPVAADIFQESYEMIHK